MAVTTVVGAALGRQLTLNERVTLPEAPNVQTTEGLARFTITIFKMIVVLELGGAAPGGTGGGVKDHHLQRDRRDHLGDGARRA